MTTVTATLYSYVPRLTRRRFEANPSPVDSPELAVYSGSLLFADIHGFTKLASRFALQGASGIEHLTTLLNAYFDRLINLIDDHGGDVVKLAGDAIVALWTEEASLNGGTVAAQRAAACGLAIQNELHNFAVAEDVTMSLRVAVGTGNAITMCLGGVNERWELLLAGDPVRQIGEADNLANAGEVVLSPQTVRALAGYGSTLPISDGFARLVDVEPPPPIIRPAETQLTSEAFDGLHAFVPAAIRSRLRSGQSEWLADLRRVSVVMVKLVDLGLEALYDLSPSQVDSVEAQRIAARTQKVIRDLQHALYRHEGSINKITVDDNGVTLVAALGLPPLAHEDNAARATRAAASMHRALQDSGMQGSVGVATGLVFCGELGNSTRREYTMNGDVMTMAARLMQAGSNDVLCDAATYSAARQRISFQSLAPRPMKGMPAPVAVYRPSLESTTSSAVGALIGRTVERSRLYARLGMLEDGKGGLVVITGEAGIGKSRLVADVLAVVSETTITSACGNGDAVEKVTPYQPWRSIFMSLLGLDPAASTSDRTQMLSHKLEEDLQIPSELLRFLPLASRLFGVDLADNAITAEMSGQMRADGANRLLIRILQAISDRAPLLIILEDGHWLDSSSWSLARMARQQVDNLLLMITTRPVDNVPAEAGWTDEDPDVEHVDLHDLSDSDLRSLLCSRLGVASVPDAVEDLVRSKTHGNPFFAEELAYTLRDRGAILVADNECRLKPGIDLASIDLPDSVQGVITSRIDRLTPTQQLTLKSASVIGRVFPYRILHDVYPIEEERSFLPDSLDTLARMDLTPLDEDEPELSYLFKHVITQDVVYQQMLFAQRRQLHRSVAQWYEEASKDLVPLAPLLAHHWSQAQNWSKAIDYLEMAGETALRNGSYQEGVSFLRDAVDIDKREDTPQRASTSARARHALVRRARWERQLGEGLLALGRTNESRAHLEAAASMLGHSAPKGKTELYLRLIRQALRQAVGYFLPKVGSTKTEHERVIGTEIARTYERMAEIHYLVNEPEMLVHAFLASGNLARASALAPELARAYANLGLAAGLIPLHGVAEAYRKRATETAAKAGQLAAQAWVLFVPSVYDAGIGKWEQATRNLGEAMSIYEQLQDRAHWGECQAMTAEVNYHQGRFARCAEIYGEMHARAIRTENTIERSWGLIGQAQGILPLGRYEEAIDLSNATAKIMADTENPDIPVAIDIRGFLAVAHLRLGHTDEALRAATTGLDIIATVSPSAVAAFEGYAGIAETLLTLWESGDALGSEQDARRGVNAFHKYAGVFPIAVARDHFYQGRLAWKRGKHSQALRHWRAGVDVAARMKMPYDEALNRGMLGLRLPGDEGAVFLEQSTKMLADLDVLPVERSKTSV